MPTPSGSWLPSTHLILIATLFLTGCATPKNDEATLARLAGEAPGVFGSEHETTADDTAALAEPRETDRPPVRGRPSRQPRANDMPAAPTASETPPGGWGVLLASATGENARATLEAQRPQMAQLLGRRDVRVSRQRAGYALVLGSYDTPGDPAAQRDLAFVKGFEVEGRRPFAQSHLMPPGPRQEERPAAIAGANSDWDLSQVRERLGREAGFTLQIGVFESVDRTQAMRAAESWVRELRAEGEEAYFYHGRTASMVSLGVFGREDWDALFDVAAPHVRALQRRYPTLRYERMDQRRSRRDAEPPPRPTTLVIIPER